MSVVHHRSDQSRVVVVEGRVVDTVVAVDTAVVVGCFVLVPIVVARQRVVPTLISQSIDGNNMFFLQTHVPSIPPATNPMSIQGEQMQ